MTQIAFNFGPVNGNVEKQEIHMKDPGIAGNQDNGCAATAEVPNRDEPLIEEEENTGKLSIGQLLIFFEAALDITFDSRNMNQKALSTFISRVSGWRESSVRQKLQKGIDYESAQVRQDAHLVAALLEKIRPDLAEIIRNNVNE